jgi:hypothetical protein
MQVSVSRRSVIGGHLYPTPSADDPQLGEAMVAVRALLFGGREFRVGAAGQVGAWRAGSSTGDLALHGRRTVFEALLKLFGALVQFGYLPSRQAIIRYARHWAWVGRLVAATSSRVLASWLG